MLYVYIAYVIYYIYHDYFQLELLEKKNKFRVERANFTMIKIV